MAASFEAFFINLDRHEDRRRFLEAQLAGAGIKAERIPGVNGADVPTHLSAYFLGADGPPCRLKPAQIGCSASHFEVLSTIVERGIDVALILEDDARLDPQLPQIIASTIEHLPDGWDIVRLCRASKRAVRPIATLTGGRRLVRFSRVPLGRAGYLVSRQGAKKLLSQRRVYGPGDVEISHPWLLGLDIYGVEPPPIAQERRELPSTIGGQRGRMSALRRLDPSRLAFNISKLGITWWLRCWVANLRRAVFKI